MRKVSDKVLEFDRSFVQELMNQPATNSTNMRIAKEMSSSQNEVEKAMILNQAKNIMLGTQEVQKVFLGSQLIWQRQSGFLPLDFIRTTNCQYFDTGYVPNENTRIECEVMLLGNYDSWPQALFGNSSVSINYNRGSGSHSLELEWGRQSASSANDFPWYQKIKIVLDKNSLSWYDKNGTLIQSISTPSGTDFRNDTLWVGCTKHGTSVFNFGEFCLYSFKIYENNQMIKNFIPVKRWSDNTAGMLDTLTNQFYPDEAGTEPFKSSVFEDNFQAVSSVQTDGNAYIDTLFVPTVNTRIVLDSIPNTAERYGASMLLFGSAYNVSNLPSVWIFLTRTDDDDREGCLARGGLGNSMYEARLGDVDLQTRCTITAEGRQVTFSYPGGTTVQKSVSDQIAIADSINTLYLFSANFSPANPGAKSSTLFYSCQIYENNVLIRDFIPAKQTADNRLVLFDRVLKIPFYPIGGNFS
ncbi:MAG: hypothetical protein V3G42_10505 [Oscillospiraceae bacterium]